MMLDSEEDIEAIEQLMRDREEEQKLIDAVMKMSEEAVNTKIKTQRSYHTRFDM